MDSQGKSGSASTRDPGLAATPGMQRQRAQPADPGLTWARTGLSAAVQSLAPSCRHSHDRSRPPELAHHANVSRRRTLELLSAVTNAPPLEDPAGRGVEPVPKDPLWGPAGCFAHIFSELCNARKEPSRRGQPSAPGGSGDHGRLARRTAPRAGRAGAEWVSVVVGIASAPDLSIEIGAAAPSGGLDRVGITQEARAARAVRAVRGRVPRLVARARLLAVGGDPVAEHAEASGPVAGTQRARGGSAHGRGDTRAGWSTARPSGRRSGCPTTRPGAGDRALT
jgi:hypothetical protein